MIPEEIQSYIDEQRQRGAADADIQVALREAGWQQETITEAFGARPLLATGLASAPKRKTLVILSIVGLLILAGGVGIFFIFNQKGNPFNRSTETKAKAEEKKGGFNFTSTKLFTLKADDKVGNAVLFFDQNSNYFISTEHYAFTNGQKTPEYKFIGQFAYNFGLGHIGFSAEKNDGTWGIVYNGKEVNAKYPKASEIVMPSLSKEPRYAFTVEQGEQQIVVVDGKPSKAYDFINRPQFTRDGKHFMYGATIGEQSFVVFDGVESKKYQQVNTIPSDWTGEKNIFQAWPDCASEDNSKCPTMIVTGGKEGNPYDDIGEFSTTTSPDGNHFAYIGIKDGKSALVVDGVEGKFYDRIEGDFNRYGVKFFSPAGNHIVYIATAEGKSFIVKDGKEGKKYASIRGGSTSNDGNHIAFIASPDCNEDALQALYFGQEGKKCSMVVVIDGQEKSSPNLIGDLTLSSDGKRLAYLSLSGCGEINEATGYPGCSKSQVIVDGKAEKEYELVFGEISFSPKGNHYAYLAGNEADGHSWLVVDGKEYDAGDSVSFSDLLLNWSTIDDTHMIFPLPNGDKTALWIDGQKVQEFEKILETQFHTDGSYGVLYQQGNDVYLGTYTFK